jgi:hypothetical protein
MKFSAEVFWVATPCGPAGNLEMFQRKLLPPSSGMKMEVILFRQITLKQNERGASRRVGTEESVCTNPVASVFLPDPSTTCV